MRKTEDLPGGQHEPNEVGDKLGTTVPQAEEDEEKSGRDPAPFRVSTREVIELSEKDDGVDLLDACEVGVTESAEVESHAELDMEMASLLREALDPEQQELRMEAVLRRVVLPAVDQAVLPVLKKVESLKAVVEKQVLRLDSLEHEAGEAGLRVKRVKISVDACCERVSSLANVATGLQVSSEKQFAGLVSQLRTLRVDVASVKEGIKAFSSLEREQRRLSAGGLAPRGIGSTVLGETDHTRQRKHRSHSESRETRTSSRKTVGHGDQDKKVRTEDVARKHRREAREKKVHEDSGNKQSDGTRERKSRRGSSRRSRSSSVYSRFFFGS